MPDVVVQGKTIHIDMTGAAFLAYAGRYREAAAILMSKARKKDGFDPAAYYLLCLSLELYLKSFIWLHDGIDIEKLWEHSKKRGIKKFSRPTKLRNHAIKLVSPYYQKRQFNYLDMYMLFKGFNNLKSEPKLLPTLDRLARQLGKSLRRPILSAG